jgi:hypothetical protein
VTELVSQLHDRGPLFLNEQRGKGVTEVVRPSTSKASCLSRLCEVPIGAIVDCLSLLVVEELNVLRDPVDPCLTPASFDFRTTTVRPAHLSSVMETWWRTGRFRPMSPGPAMARVNRLAFASCISAISSNSSTDDHESSPLRSILAAISEISRRDSATSETSAYGTPLLHIAQL